MYNANKWQSSPEQFSSFSALKRVSLLFIITVIIFLLMMVTFHFLSRSLQATQQSKFEESSTVQTLSGTGIMTSTDLLAIYALAFDNNPSDPMSLSLYYTSTINSIAEATLDAPDKTAVILADLDQSLDTRILIAQNGQLIPVDGLPISNPTGGIPLLDQSVVEYNMSNGTNLGLFLQWTRHTFSANAVTFSFLGHGAPLVPEISPGLDFQSPSEGTPTVLPPPAPTPSPVGTPQPTPEPVPPLPAGFFAHSGFTDFTSSSLISIHALATALEMGTNNGANPFQTVDLVQCFASSIEELYELYPYAETITGSPNYAYSKPEMIGTALGAISSDMSALQIADTLIQTYDNELPATEHPRLLVAVDTSKIEAIKESWDNTSYHLNQMLVQEREATMANITNAYAASAKYDTTLCTESDFRLDVPDSVSDMSDFANQLSTLFGPTSPTGSWAITTTQRIDDAIVSRYARNGVPWFAQDDELIMAQAVDNLAADTSTVPEWIFESPGISLYTDFGSAVNNESPVRLDWFSAWYTDTANVSNPVLLYKNTTPYSFLEGGPDGISWADVFSQFWGPAGFENVRCKPAFLAGRGIGEMKVLSFSPSAVSNRVLMPDSTFLLNRPVENADGEFIRFSVEISTSIEAVNPQIRFHVYDSDDERIFAEGALAGYLEASETKTIQSAFRWPVSKPGTYTFEVILDADDRFIESDEEDNVARIQVEFAYVPYFVQLPIVHK